MGQSMNVPPLVIKPERLEDLLVTMLTDSTGKSVEHWRQVLGTVTPRPLTMNARSNWEVRPTAEGDDRYAVEKAIQIARFEYPYVG